MARKKKPPFKDDKGKWYAILGKKKPRPFSERALRKALKDIEDAKATEAHVAVVEKQLLAARAGDA